MVAICCNRLKIVCVIAAAARFCCVLLLRSATVLLLLLVAYDIGPKPRRKALPGTVYQVGPTRYDTWYQLASSVTLRTVDYHSLRVMSFAVDLQSVLVDIVVIECG